jgi:hypothetical protein
MNKAHKPSDSGCYMPWTEPFRLFMKYVVVNKKRGKRSVEGHTFV